MSLPPLPDISVPNGNSRFNSPTGSGFASWFASLKASINVALTEIRNQAVTSAREVSEASLGLANAYAKEYTDTTVKAEGVLRGAYSTVGSEVSFAVTDEDGRRSWLEILAATGGPTPESALLILDPLLNPLLENVASELHVLEEMPVTAEAIFAIVDDEGKSPLWIDAEGVTHLLLPQEDGGASTAADLIEVSGAEPARQLWMHPAEGGRVLIQGTNDPREPVLTTDRHVHYRDNDGYRRAPVQGGTPIPLFPDRKLATVGDSLTAADIYPKYISDTLGIPYTKLAVGGWSSGDVAILQGGLNPTLTLAGDTLAGPGSTVVTAVSPDASNYTYWNANATFSWTGYLITPAGDVPGRLVRAHVDGVKEWRFERTTSGAAVTCPPLSAVFHCTEGDAVRGHFQIIFVGRNNTFPGVALDVQRMIDNLSPYRKEFLTVGVLNAVDETQGTGGHTSVIGCNNAVQQIAPGNYYDLRRDFIDSGLQVAGITPTQADLDNIAADAPPPSLMVDPVHPTSAGYIVIGKLITAELLRKGWLN